MKQVIILFLFTISLWSNEFEEAVKDYKNGNYIKALNAFYVLAKNGDVQAEYNVGLMYANGKGVKADIVQAIEWYEKAANHKNAAAAYNLAVLYEAMENKDVHAYEKAKFWYEKAALEGLPQAQNNLAALYLDGKYISKDTKKAFELFKKAAAQGDVNAQINVAIMYAWNKEITQDKMKAYENFIHALDAGHHEAGKYLDQLCKESPWVCKK